MCISNEFIFRPVRMQRWKSEYLIYNILTASTHLLDSISGGVFNQIYHKNISKQELIQYMMNKYDMSHLEAVQYVGDVLEKFQVINLIEIRI